MPHYTVILKLISLPIVSKIVIHLQKTTGHGREERKKIKFINHYNLTSNIPSVHPPCPCCKDWTISRSRSTFTWSPIASPQGPDLDPGPDSPVMNWN